MILDIGFLLFFPWTPMFLRIPESKLCVMYKQQKGKGLVLGNFGHFLVCQLPVCDLEEVRSLLAFVSISIHFIENNNAYLIRLWEVEI